MVVGHYERTIDSGMQSVIVAQNQNGSYSVKIFTESSRNSSHCRHSEWGFDARLLSNSLNHNVAYYSLNLNFNDDHLTIIDTGKNPFFAPGVSYAGAFSRALIAVG